MLKDKKQSTYTVALFIVDEQYKSVHNLVTIATACKHFLFLAIIDVIDLLKISNINNLVNYVSWMPIHTDETLVYDGPNYIHYNLFYLIFYIILVNISKIIRISSMHIYTMRSFNIIPGQIILITRVTYIIDKPVNYEYFRLINCERTC